jgi:phenylacetate-CoA ligase
MRRMARITGRSDDMLIIRGVNLFPSQIEEQILAEPSLSAHYVLEVTRPRALDELKVLVEARPGAEGSAAARSLEQRIKAHIGVTATVEIAEPGTVERSLGKAKRVIDRRPKA